MSSAVVCHGTCSPPTVKTTGDGSGIEEHAHEIRRRHDRRCRFESVTEPHQAGSRHCDQGEHDCERPTVDESHDAESTGWTAHHHTWCRDLIGFDRSRGAPC